MMTNTNGNHNNGNSNSEQQRTYYFSRDGVGVVSATVKLSDGLSLIQSMREWGWWFCYTLEGGVR